MQFRSVRSHIFRAGVWATSTGLLLGLTLACSNEAAESQAQSNTAGEGGEGAEGGSGGGDDRVPMGGSTEPSPVMVDASIADSAADAGGEDAKDAGNLVPAIMGAGYGGIRTISFDDGLTWKTLAIANRRNADDENLIRGVGYVGGVWIAVGWKVFRSVDGRQWTEADLPGGWYDCVSESNGKIIVKTIRSDYGGQNGDTLSSSDQGRTWQEVRANKPVCNYTPKPFPAGNALVRGRGGIERSTDQGKTWKKVFEDCCWVETFAAGRAAR